MVSGATLQSSGNINLTSSTAQIYATTASAYLADGTPTGGGSLYLNSQGNTGILITGIGISNNLPTTFSSPPICATNCTTSTQIANKAYVDSVIPSLTNYVTTNTAQTITGLKTFTSINNTTYNLMDGVNNEGSLSTTATTCSLSLPSGNNYALNVGGVNVSQADIGGVVNNKYTFGRNDGAPFTVISLTGPSANLYPIGYCWEVLGGVTQPVNATDLTSTASISLPMGVWAISGYIVLNKGNGAYVVGSNISALWPVNIAGIKLYPNSSGVRVSIASTSTTNQHIIPIGTVNVVITTANAIQTITRNVIMTCGTTTSWQVSFTGVKIA